MTAPATRVEHDLLGPIDVPHEALYGAQTQRAVLNFPLRGEKSIGSYPRLIEGLLLVKWAAALANTRSGFLDAERGHAIVSACGRLLDALPRDQFPVHRLHGGGTSANMNANEVVANVAEELLGGRRGEYRLVQPNDHVNLHQSTNDVYPTACHIAIIRQWPDLDGALGDLIRAVRDKGAEWRDQPRLARTCLQDAVAVTFGDLFGGYATFLDRARARIARAVDELHAVNLGGTIVGRPADTPGAYVEYLLPALREVTGSERYRTASDLFDAAQNPDDMVSVGAALAVLARGFVKIAKDLRLLASGPEGGLGEIRLPPVQPGSSVMPGKINPVIPEFAIQLSLQALGCVTACGAALEHGELDLNVWESVIVFNVLDAVELLTGAASALDAACIRGLQVDAERSARHARTIVPLLTELGKRYGYARVSEVCRRAAGDLATLHRLLRDEGLV